MDSDRACDVKFDNGLGSKLDSHAPRAMTNREALAALMAALRAEEDSIRKGGGANAAKAQHAKGRLTVRERLKLLLDEGTELLELGLWAAHGMYGEYGGAPGAGVVTTRGLVRYVATEFGVANLHGKSIRERAKALIEIAHPKFRDELYQYCEKTKWLQRPQAAEPAPSR